MAEINWVTVRTEYETTNTSQRKLCEKYDISYPTLRDKCNREGWAKSKKKTRSKILAKTLQKTVTKIATKESDINTRHIAVLDKILDMVEKIIDDELTKILTSSGEAIEVELIQIDKLEAIARVLEKAQKGHRLALGMDKADDSNDAANKHNEKIMFIAQLLNNPVADRKVEDFKDDA